MSKTEVGYTDYLRETFEAMSQTGLLLSCTDGRRKQNVMAIGWGTIGIIWGKPVFIVLVRPSRFTYGLIDCSGDFTVNVPSKDLADTVSFCGTVSGRDHDKFGERGLTVLPGRKVKSPLIEECPVHYECRVVHKNDVLPEELAQDIIPPTYPRGDYHRIFFGEILSVLASSHA